MRRSWTPCWIIGTLAAFILASGASSPACDGSPPSEVKVSVVAILASEQSTQIDPRLKGIAAEVRKTRPLLTGFRYAKMTCKPVAVKSAEAFDLVADQQATVTVLKPADKDNRVQLKISLPTVAEITYTTACGKFFPIVTNYQTANKESLIIAIRVQPCNKK
jgi:hypothetical protein